MTAELDLAAVRLALAKLAQGPEEIAINLSGESVSNSHFRRRIREAIANRPELAPRLWLEVAEHGAFRHIEEFRLLCTDLHVLGCRLGIEHFGRQFKHIAQLHEIRLDYLKVDSSFIRSIDCQKGNQTFLKGLCGIAHNMGLIVIAEGVQTTDELAALPELGFDGGTGPAVPRNN